jgi:hypothetical protein
MKPSILFQSIALALTIGTLLAGCSTDDQPGESSAPAMSAASDNNVDKSEISDAMAKLSPEDRALVEAQKVCPVSNEPLGSMGEPIKVTVNGQHIFVCCKGCIDELKANFDKYADKVKDKS